MKRPIKSGLAVDGKISAVQGTEPGEVVVLDGSGKLPVDNLNTILVQQGGTGVTVLPEGALLQGNGINAVTRADSVGGTTQPIYIDIDGKAKTISYTVSKSVPADAVFTDTTYENRQAAEGGTDLSLVTTGDKYNWDHMEDTDTKDTAGSTDTSSKIFIIGAASQTSYSQTYSHDTAYVGTDGCLYSDGQKVLTSHQSLAAYAPLDSPALTGMPTAPTAASGTDTTQIATTAFVQDAVSASHIVTDAMVFKGTIGTGGTVASLPADHTVGWTYKVITAGSYAGKNCEVGDLIICTNTRVTANNDDWTVAQTNIDGAVTGPANAVDTHIAVFDGTSVHKVE